MPADRTLEHGPGARLLTVACLLAIADSLLIMALPPLVPYYQHTLNIGSTPTGVLVGGYSIGLLAGSIPAGYMTASRGPRAIVLVGIGSLALSGALFGVASNFPALLAARIAGGVSSAFSWTGILTWCIERTSPARRDHVYGIVFGAGFIGVTLGPTLGALADQIGTQRVFVAFAVGAAVLIPLVLWLGEAPRAAESANLAALATLTRAKGVAAALTLQALPGFLSGALGLLLTLRLAQLGIRASGIATVFVVAALAQGVASILVGRWSSRAGARGPAIAGVFTAGCLTACFVVVGNAIVISAILVVVLCATAVILVAGSSLLGSAVARTGEIAAYAYALMNLAFAPGAIVGSIASGALRDAAGQTTALLTVAAVCLFAVVPVLRSGSGLARSISPSPAATGDEPAIR